MRNLLTSFLKLKTTSMIKKTLFALSSIFLMAIGIYLSESCNKKEKKESIQIGNVRLFAIVLDTSGKKIPTIVIRVISEAIKFDSITKQKTIGYDTVFGVERSFQLRDSLNKPIKDSLGNPRYGTGYFAIGKDSVNTNVCGQPIDSLIKK